MKQPGNDFMPSFSDSSGSNYFGRDSMFLHVVSLVMIKHLIYCLHNVCKSSFLMLVMSLDIM